MKTKLNNPQKRYGILYTCYFQHIGTQVLKDVEIMEWADTIEEVRQIEPIFREWHKSVHEPLSNKKNELPDVLYGSSGYTIIDYQEKRIVKRIGYNIPGFDDAPYDKLRLLDNLFTTDEVRKLTRPMSMGEYIGWLRFKYGDGLNAIYADNRKPIATKDLYEECLIRDYWGVKNGKNRKYEDENK